MTSDMGMCLNPYYHIQLQLDLGDNLTQINREISRRRQMSALMSVESESKRLAKDLAEEGAAPSTIKQILIEAKPEWGLLAFCCFASVIQGLAMPVSSILFNQIFLVRCINIRSTV